MQKNRDLIFYAGAALIVFSAFLAATTISSLQKKQARLSRLIHSSAIENRLSGIFSVINDFPGSAGKDLLFLRSLSSVVSLFDNGGGSAYRARQDLSQFLENNSVYEEIFVRSGSLCLLSISAAGDDKGSSPCVGAPDDLSANSVRISPLTLHQSRNGNKFPALFYSIKSLDGNGSLTAVVNADYFLEEIRRLQRDGEKVFLLSKDGSYLAHFDRFREALAGGDDNFYSDFPDAPHSALSNLNVRHIETKDRFFTFLRITPTASNFILYNGDGNSEEDYWILAAVSENIDGQLWWADFSYIALVVSALLSHALALLFWRYWMRSLSHESVESIKL